MDCAVPGEGEALRGGDALPVGVALEDVGVAAFEHFARDVVGDEVLDFLVRGPDVFQEDGLAVLVPVPSGSVVRSFCMVPASA